jgi:UDP-glucose 6-dehydrogenase
MLYDLAIKLGCNYEKIKQGMAADPRIGSTHLSPVHQGGRGAGGHCFIKDFAAFSTFYKELIGDYEGRKVLESLKEKNLSLLLNSKKDLDLLLGVYGKSVLGKKFRKM